MSNTLANPQEDKIQNHFETSEYILQRINSIKAEHEKQNINALNSNDKIKECILEIAQFMEHKYIENGSDFMINQISTNIIVLLENKQLGQYTALASRVLPEQYKDKSHNKWKNMQKKIVMNQAEKLLKDFQNLNLGILDSDQLYELKDLGLDQIVTPVEDVLKLKGYKPTKPEDTQFEQLDKAEKEKFQPAKVGEPLTELEKLCQDPQYKEEFDGLVKELDIAIKIAEFNKYWFTKYFPLSIQSCIKLRNGFHNWNKWWQPYSDQKYRRDHWQLLKICMTKVNETSVKASKESRIPCMWHVDKDGKPILRGLTKEQIDAMYVSETNFLIAMVDTAINMGKDISEANEEHGTRCRDDRAVALSAHLSHHA